jgi:hypothetical protein
MIDLAWILTLLLTLALVYFAPALIARDRRHPNGAAIFAVNLLLGWTVVGWGTALVWAVGAIKPVLYGRRVRLTEQLLGPGYSAGAPRLR